jgi:hypothetical protein
VWEEEFKTMKYSLGQPAQLRRCYGGRYPLPSEIPLKFSEIPLKHCGEYGIKSIVVNTE